MKFATAKNFAVYAAIALQTVTAACQPVDISTESTRRGADHDATFEASAKGADVVGDNATDDSGRNAASPVQGAMETNYACTLLDPDQDTTAVIAGGPTGLKIPISKYVKTPGMLTYASTSQASFKFSAFKHRNIWTLEWPSGVGAYFIHNFEATITAADTAKCLISAKETSAPEARTMLGCFDPATKIQMGNGTRRKIDALKMGDLVLNPVTGKVAPVVRITKGPEAGKGLYLIGFGGKGAAAVKVTSKHPFMTNLGLRTAAQLAPGDRILTTGGLFRKLDVVQALPESAGQIVVNIALGSTTFAANDHMVLADGIVSGDLLLQERLENMSRLSSLNPKN